LKLKEMVQSHKTVYTPCLGLSELLANFEFMGEYSFDLVENTSEVDVLTALPKKNVVKLNFLDDYEYLSETLPRNMLPDRSVTEYTPVIFERKTRPVKAQVNTFVRLENDEVITFL
jgi:CRISPR-associated protein Cas5h